MINIYDIYKVRKEEAEKEFRVTEEYLGSDLLTEEELEEINHERYC
jgi:hypothetical protein